MFGEVAAFEFRHLLRSPLFWIVTGIFFLLVFGFMASDHIHIGDTANVHKNSPFAIGQTHLIMTLFYMFAGTAFVAGAVTRDDETGFGPIIRAAPLAKFDYLYGRFVGAFAALALSFLAVTAAMIVGSFLPWLDPEQLGPFRPDAYAFAYVVLALPVLFFTSALFFAVATVARSMAWTFVAVIAVIVLYVVASIALGKPDMEALLARWDPFGLFAFDTATTYWTASDRNNLLPSLGGALLFSRLFSLGLGAAALALGPIRSAVIATPHGQGLADDHAKRRDSSGADERCADDPQVRRPDGHRPAHRPNAFRHGPGVKKPGVLDPPRPGSGQRRRRSLDHH